MGDISKWAEIETFNAAIQTAITIVDVHRIHVKHINEQTIQLFTQLMESMGLIIDQCVIYQNVKMTKIDFSNRNSGRVSLSEYEKHDSNTIKKAKPTKKLKENEEIKEKSSNISTEQEGHGSKHKDPSAKTAKKIESKRKSVSETGAAAAAAMPAASAPTTLKTVPKPKRKANKTAINQRYPKIIARIKPLLLTYARCIQQTKLEINRIEKKNYDNILMELKEIYGGTYPNVQTYYFGSHITGLQLHDSDIDIFVDLDNFYDSNPTREESLKRIHSADHLMYVKMNNFKIVKCISHARTPIINVRHRPTRIVCDLSFTNGLAHCNSKLIKYLLHIQPVCYNVALFIKLFVQRLNICMNTYTSLIFVIFFFQQNGLLPPIHRLQCNVETPRLIGGWQANFETLTLSELNIPLIKPTIPETHQYILGFFEYYGKIFQYENDVVCPLIGKPINRILFADVNSLPKELIRYTDYVMVNDDKQDVLNVSTKMCVQDPFELIHNVAKAIPTQGMEIFKAICLYAYEMMKINAANDDDSFLSDDEFL